MKSLQVVLVAGFIFSLLQIGTCQCDVVRLAAAVHETLSPFTTEMREGLAAVKTEIRDGLAAVKTEMRDGLA
ncbi:hypothetical protein GBAR_LOCUS27048, partial [Geodia barretti]